MFSMKELRLRQAVDIADAKLEELRARAAKAEKDARDRKSELQKVIRHQTWHEKMLATELLRNNIDGEMAFARIHLLNLSPEEYIAAITEYRALATSSSVVAIERAAINANISTWHHLGRAIVLERERRAYEQECHSWAQFGDAGPNAPWRAKQVTLRQYYLIDTTADHLSIPKPLGAMSRGEAHDWLMKNGANVRLKGSTEDKSAQPTTEQRTTPAEGQQADASIGSAYPDLFQNPQSLVEDSWSMKTSTGQLEAE